MSVSNPTTFNALPLIFFAYLFYTACLAVYRLFIHPLRRYPGPRLAASTSWYGAYFNIVRNGGLPEHLDVLHKQYGPVVRIAPNELHFNDHKSYSTIYATGSKFIKDADFYRTLGIPLASAGIVNPHTAKVRREVLGSLFSRRATLKLESVVEETASKLVSNLAAYAGSLEAIDLHQAYRCATLDTITSYAFAQPTNALDHGDFQAPLLDAMDAAISFFWVFERFPWLRKLIYGLPKYLLPAGPRRLMFWRDKIQAQVDSIIADPTTLDRDVPHEIIYHHLYAVRPEKGQYDLPSRESLFQEAQVMVAAGSDTTASICFVATFHVLRNPHVRETLVKELKEAFPDAHAPLRYQELEKLPYFTAVLKEALRIKGAVSPLRRKTPQDMEINGFQVPEGTTVSVGSQFLQYDKDVFPDPYRFNPGRWLVADTRKLEEYFVPFGRGPRMCLGQNLAWCELYLMVGSVLRKVDLRLDDSSAKRLSCRDYFFPRYDGREVSVHVKSCPK